MMKAILRRALVLTTLLLTTLTVVGGCGDDEKECYSADSCYIYCEKRYEGNCAGLSLTVGECVDQACGVYRSTLPPDCIKAWAKYYDCRLGNPDICIEEQCQNPSLLPACAPAGG